jgi:hypothetical protein
LRLLRLKISIYPPCAEERFETARHPSSLHPEGIVGNPEVISRNVGESEHCRRKAILSTGARNHFYANRSVEFRVEILI